MMPRASASGPGAARGIPPALPIPGAQAVARPSGDRRVPEQPTGKQKASCSPRKACGQGLLAACPQLLRQGDAVPACMMPAGQHPREGAAPRRGMGCFTPNTIQAWRCSHISASPALPIWKKPMDRAGSSSRNEV